MNHTVKGLKATAKSIGLKVSGTKDELIQRIVEWMERGASDDVVRAMRDDATLESLSCHAYRPVRVDELVVGMPTHNGYCTDSIGHVTRTKPANYNVYQSGGKNREDYVYSNDNVPKRWVTYSLHQTKRVYYCGMRVDVNLRWLMKHDPKYQVK